MNLDSPVSSVIMATQTTTTSSFLTTQTTTTSSFLTTKATMPPVPGRQEFSWQDYLVFAISLVLPLAIGLFFYLSHRLKKRKLFSKKGNNEADDIDCTGDTTDEEYESTEHFLLGNRSINFVAAGLSTLASLLNGVFVVGMPAEVHYQGVAICYLALGFALASPLVCHIIVPAFHRMKLTSAYEYIEHRFNKAARLVASSIFVVSTLLFLVLVLYVPAFAFTQVTSLSLYLTVIVTGGICTIYTAIGGMKAVVYTDALQIIILLIGLIVLSIIGARNSGGVQHVWEVARINGRLNFDSLSPDPRVRMTFWTQVIGHGVIFWCLLVSNQMVVQRFMAVSTPRKAKMSLYMIVFVILLLVMLIMFVGLVVHATYFTCDPLVSGQISSSDQIFLHFVMTTVGDYKGVPGLMVATIFAASLSSVSSVVNSLSAVFLEDIISPAYLHFKKSKLSDNAKQKIAVFIVIFFGLVTIGLALAAGHFTSKLSQAVATIWGIFGAPLGGMFFMGFFIPFCNSLGAIIGCLGGLAFTLWIVIGSFIFAPPIPTLPIGACSGNLTLILPIVPANASQTTLSLAEVYGISYGWYGLIGVSSTILIGCIVSALSGGCKREHTKNLPKHLWFSCADEVCGCCPEPRCCKGRSYDDADGNGASRDDGAEVGGSIKGHSIYAIEKFASNNAVLKQVRRHSPDGERSTSHPIKLSKF